MSAAPDQIPTKTTTMQALKPAQAEVNLPEVSAGFGSLRAFELLQRAGKALSASSLVPDIYRNNISNCIIALEMAQRIGASPLMVMQNLYIVYNRPAWSAKFLIACFNQCGRFSTARYIWSGTRGKDDWGCQAWSTEKETGEKIFGPVITMQLAKDEGWHGRKDSKWKTMPEKMFMYRAAAWMIDTHAPELSMGIKTEEEVHDTYDASRGPDGAYTVTTEALRQAEATTAGNDATPVQSQPNTLLGNAGGFDKDSAIQALNEAGDIVVLNEAWDAIITDYDNTKRPLPIEVEIKFKDRKAGFEAASGK